MLKSKHKITVTNCPAHKSRAIFDLPLGPAGAIRRSRNVWRSAIRSVRVNVSRPSRANWRNAWLRSGIFWTLFRAIDIDSNGVEDNTKRDSIFTCAPKMTNHVWCMNDAIRMQSPENWWNKTKVHENVVVDLLALVFCLSIEFNSFLYPNSIYLLFRFQMEKFVCVLFDRAIENALLFSRISYVAVIKNDVWQLTFVAPARSWLHLVDWSLQGRMLRPKNTSADSEAEQLLHVNNLISARLHTGIRHLRELRIEFWWQFSFWYSMH